MNTNTLSLPEISQALDKLRLIVQKIPTSKEQVAASMDCCVEIGEPCEPKVDYSDLSAIYQYIDQMLSYLRTNLSDIQTQLWAHINNGHLPVIRGADGMVKALKALGMDGDYQVEKETVYANNGAPKEVLIKIAFPEKKSATTA